MSWLSETRAISVHSAAASGHRLGGAGGAGTGAGGSGLTVADVALEDAAGPLADAGLATLATGTADAERLAPDPTVEDEAVAGAGAVFGVGTIRAYSAGSAAR